MCCVAFVSQNEKLEDSWVPDGKRKQLNKYKYNLQFRFLLHDLSIQYSTIIPRKRVGYELLDNGQGTENPGVISHYVTSVSWSKYQTSADFSALRFQMSICVNIATVYYY